MNYNHPPERVYDHDFSVDQDLLEELQKNVEEFDIISDLSILYKVC